MTAEAFGAGLNGLVQQAVVVGFVLGVVFVWAVRVIRRLLDRLLWPADRWLTIRLRAAYVAMLRRIDRQKEKAL